MEGIEKMFKLSFITAGVFILILGLGFFYFLYRNKRNRQREKQKNSHLKSRFKILETKIRPHFLFNTLNSIVGMGYENNPREVEKLVNNLSEMYRRILYLPANQVVTLNDEIKVVKNYLYIEKVRLGDRLKWEFSVDDQVLSSKIAPFTVFIMVESFVNVISGKEEGGTIDINLYKNNGCLMVKVTNAGIDCDYDKSNPLDGAREIRERIVLLYKNRADFNIKPLPGKGTEVTLKIPY